MSDDQPRIEDFENIDAYTLGDAARRQGVGGVIQKLTPQTQASRFIGRALTARISLQPNRQSPLGSYGAGALLDRVAPGYAVVLDGGGQFLSALGDLAALIIQRRGGVAAVVNAAVRDVEDINPGFPMFALGAAINSIAAHGVITGVGEPVSIDGLPIVTGDLVCGCRGGVVVVPWGERSGVLRDANEILESDRRVREGLIQGDSLGDLWAQHKNRA